MAEQRNGLLLLAWATCFLLGCIFAGCAGDVPDGVVYTDLHKTVKKGDSATLKCEFRGEPIAVYWKKKIGKDQWTDLVTWVEGTMLPGSCLADDSCEMNQDYSLIINHVQIADRGRYMCRISNYLGILIHNYTDVTVYARPEEPYPIIKECTPAENQPSAQRCSIRANNTSVDITCSASSFFPELNLFFLHGSDKVSNTVSNVSTNEDGTKNKFISIKGSRSEIPYVCVASDIPGSTDERTATVFLRPPTVSTPRVPDRSSYPSLTTMASEDRTDPAGAVKPAKIVVPIIIIALAGGTVLIVYCWLKRRRSAPASGEKDVEETQPMLQTIKVHVEGMVSYYELWSLAYNTPTEDMGKVCTALGKLGMEISNEQTRSEHVYEALYHWKKTAKPKEQAQKFRDALEDAELGNRWQQIYGDRRQATAKVSEGIFEQILLDLESPRKIKKFLHKLISKGETTVDNTKEKDAIVANIDLNKDNAEEVKKLVSGSKSNVGGEDDKNDDVSDAENYDEVSDAGKKKDLVQEAMRKLKEWNKGPFSENPYVLLSLALEGAGCTHVSRTIFDGIVSFYELRSLLYNMKTPDMKKLHNLIKELEEVEDVKAGLGPQQIYESLCQWKEKHNKGDQAKILRDALERANLSEAWLKIPETRQQTAKVSEGTLKRILLEIRDPIKIQQFLGKLVPGSVRHQNASDDKDVIQQAIEILRDWNKGPFDENPMILLSRALERGGCNPVDRTFFYGTISYFELWSLVNHSNKNDIRTLYHALHELGIQDVQDTNTLKRVYVQLSEWKNQYHAFDQLLALKMLLEEAELLNLFEDLHERRNRTDAKISDDTLEHVLWHVKDPNKMYSFLLELKQKSRDQGPGDSKPAGGIARAAALEELKKWSKGTFDENPVVQLSLALERAKCSPVDRTFFKVPIQLQKPIENTEVEMFVHKLTSRHCKRLAKSLSTIEKGLFEITDEDNEVLFDTKSVIREWIANKECSNYEKRRRLDDVVIKIGRRDMTDTFKTTAYRQEAEGDLTQPHPSSEFFDHDTIFDDDLISLAKLMSCLDARIMSTFCMSVGISDQVKEAFKHRPVAEVLCKWRDSNLTLKTPNGSLESVFSQITELMGDKTYVKYVTDGELAFIEKQLQTINKKERFLSGLHIHRNKKGKWIMKLKGINQKEKISVSGRKEEETGNGEVEVQNEAGIEGGRPGNEGGGAGNEGNGTGNGGYRAGNEGGGAENEGGGARNGGDGAGNGGDGAGNERGVAGNEGGGAGNESEGAGNEGGGAGNESDGAGNVGDGAANEGGGARNEGGGAGNGGDGAANEGGGAGNEGGGAGNEGDGAGKEGDGEGNGGDGAGGEGGGAGDKGGGAGIEGGRAGGEGGGGRNEGDGAGNEGGGAGDEGGGAGNEGGGAGNEGDGAGIEGGGAGDKGGGVGKERRRLGKVGGGARKDEAEEETYVPNVKDRGVDSVFTDLLNEWRNRCGGKSCRKKLRTVLKTMRMEECIVNKTPRKYMYKAELVRVAFHLLMNDVLPVIQALEIDQRKVKTYRRQNPNLEKGSLSLLIQLCPETKQVQAYSRRDFLPVLLKFGYVDAAKSLYLDYEQSLCELSTIVSQLDKDKFLSFINQLGISSDELTECSGTNEEAYRIEMMGIWKSKIRPVPYHYRLHIVTALQAIGCEELAGEVLSGYHRRSAANDDVIRAICSRLGREPTKRLCVLLKLKPDEEQKISTTKIVNWVNNWMDEYNPSPKVIKGKSLDKFLPRKRMNNELVKAGCYELANEIMRLEFSRF